MRPNGGFLLQRCIETRTFIQACGQWFSQQNSLAWEEPLSSLIAERRKKVTQPFYIFHIQKKKRPIQGFFARIILNYRWAGTGLDGAR
jgi:Fe-S cluster biosynthesis and repair protein YggX